MANTISNSFKVRVVNQNGSLLQAPASVPTLASAAFSDITKYSNTALMLANDATTYANAVTYANGVATNAYSNAVTYANGVATNAYSNAVTYANAAAANAYSNAVSYVDGKSFVNTSTLAIDLASYQTIAGLAFAVSNLQANSAIFLDGVTITTIDNRITSNASAAYTNAVSYVDGKSFVNTAQLSGNLTNYQTTAGLSANVARLTANNSTNAFGKTEINLNVNNALTANNSTNFGGVSLATVNSAITGNAATAYANAVANAAALYQTTAGLSANVARLAANSATFLGNSSGTIANVASWITGNAAAAYTNAVANAAALYQTTAGLSANVSTLAANSATFLGNSSGTIANVTSWITGNAATAYTNATSYADSAAGNAYSNAVANAAALYQTTAGLSANVARLAANSATFLGNSSGTIANVASWITGNSATAYANATSYADSVAATAYTNAVANAAALYQTTAGLSANVARLAANSATFLGNSSGTIANVASWITGNAAAAYTNAVSNAAALYQTTAGLAANVATLPANSATFLGNSSGTIANVASWITGNAATAYTNATGFASNASNISSGTLAEARLPFRMDQNVRTTDSVNFGSVTISGNLTVNGSYTVVTGNSVVYTDNMLFLNQGISANITNIVGNGSVVTFTANNNYQVGWDVLVTDVDPSSYNGKYFNITFANSTVFRVSNTNTASYVSGGVARGQTESNPDVGFAAGYNDGTYRHAGFFRDHATGVWKVFDGYLPEPDASVYIDQSNNSFNIAPFQANVIYVGNTTVFGTVNTTNFSGTSNNTTNLGGLPASSYVNTSQLSSNLSNYQTTAGLSANVATLAANSATFLGNSSGTIANVASWITGNAASAYTNAISYADSAAGNAYSNAVANAAALYQTTAGLSANVATLAANSATFLGNSSGTIANVVTWITGNAATTYANATLYADSAAGNAYSNAVANAAALYQTTAGLSANVATLAANSATFLGNSSGTIANVVSWITGNAASAYTNAVADAAALYQTTAGLAANVATLAANSATFLGNSSGTIANVVTWITGNAATAYANAIAFASNASNINTGTLSNARLDSNVVNTSANFTITGMQTFVSGITVSNTITANGSNGVAGYVLTSSGPTGNVHWAEASGGFTNGQSISVNNFVINGAFTANGSNGSTGEILISNGTGVYWGPAPTGGGGTVTQVNTGIGLTGGPISVSGTISVLANSGIVANTSGLFVNASYIATLDANNASFLGGASLTGINSAISGNADTAYTNAVNYVTSQSFVNTSQLSANLSLYQTTAALAANVLLLTANDASNFNGQPASFYTNATNLSTGTLNNDRLPSAINITTVNAATLSVGTTSVVNSAGFTTSANVLINSTGELVLSPGAGIFANGSLGSAGQILASNGSSVYWSTSGSSSFVRQTFTANATVNTTFTVSGGYTANYIDVYKNGVKLINGVEVTVTNGSTVVLAAAAAVGDIVDVVGLIASSVIAIDTTAQYAWSNTQTFNANLVSNSWMDIRSYVEVESTPTISSGTLTLDLANSMVFDVLLNSNITTLTISNVPATALRAVSFVLILTADGTARAITWPASFRWSNGNTAPTITSTNGKRDILTFLSTDNGTSWNAFITGQNI